MLSGDDVSAKETERPEQSVQELVTFIRQEEAASRTEKISYPDAPLTQKDGMNLAHAIKQFDTDTIKELTYRLPMQSEMSTSRKKLWRTFIPVIPNLPKTYSDSAFFHALIHDVPRILAPYWIYSDRQVITYRNGEVLDALEVRSDILTIRDKKPLHANVFGTDIDSHVLLIDKPIGNTTRKEGELANVCYGNIFIQDHAGEKTIAVWNVAKSDVLQDLGGVDGEPAYLPKDDGFRNDIVCTVALKDLFKRSSEPSVKECEDSHIAHELGHVVNGSDVRFKKAFEITKELNSEQFVAVNINENSHDELDAILSSLRYSSHKGLPLFELLNYLISNRNKTALAHHNGSLWIRQRIMEEMSRDPEKYGVVFKNSSPFTEGEQLLLALPRLVMEQSQILDPLWESLWKLHRQQLGVNLLDAAMQSPYPQPESKREKSTDSFLPLMGAGIGACGIFAALHALRKKIKAIELEKRRVTELSTQLSKLLTNRATGDQLIQDLQLGMRGKGVDFVAREQAYETITKISRSNKDLRQHMKVIRVLIGMSVE